MCQYGFGVKWCNVCVCSSLRTSMACTNYEVVRILTGVPTSDRVQTIPSHWVPEAHYLSPTRRSSMSTKRDKLYE